MFAWRDINDRIPLWHGIYYKSQSALLRHMHANLNLRLPPPNHYDSKKSLEGLCEQWWVLYTSCCHCERCSQCSEHEEGDCLLCCLSMTFQYLTVSCVPLVDVGYLPNISKYDTWNLFWTVTEILWYVLSNIDCSWHVMVLYLANWISCLWLHHSDSEAFKLFAHSFSYFFGLSCASGNGNLYWL